MLHYENADLDAISPTGGKECIIVPSSQKEGTEESGGPLSRRDKRHIDVENKMEEVHPVDCDDLRISESPSAAGSRIRTASGMETNLTAEEEALIQSFSASFANPALNLGRQADDENDARAHIPYRINKETFTVPLVCPDDLLSGSNRIWSPGKPLRIAYVTWNMAGAAPKIGEVSSFCIHPNAHLVVVATQEDAGYFVGNGKQKKWLKAVETQCLNNNYKLVGKTHMWALHLMIFARSRDVASYISYVDRSKVKTGTNGVTGNKGGIAISLSLSMLERADFSKTTAGRLAETAKHSSTNPPAGTSKPPITPSPAPKDASKGNASAEVAPAASHSNTNSNSNSNLNVHSPKGNNGGTDSPAHTQDTKVSFVCDPESGPSTPDQGFEAEGQEEIVGNDGDPCPVPQITLLFINAHLAPHQTAVGKRNRDYKKIVRELRVGKHGKYSKKFKRQLKQKRFLSLYDEESGVTDRHSNALVRPSKSAQANTTTSTQNDNANMASRNVSSYEDDDDDASIDEMPTLFRSVRKVPIKAHRDVTEEFDLTFFGGDLNYRIDGTKDAIEYIVQNHRNIRSILINNDQLSLERSKGTVFNRFHEGTLYFRPTYKYEVSNGVTLDQYNFSKKKDRMPAYCDRILYKRGRGSVVGKIGIKLYTDVPNVRTSDHRPVVSIFEIDTKAFKGGQTF